MSVRYEVSDELHRRLEAAAARRHQALDEFVLEALEIAVAREPDAEPLIRREPSPSAQARQPLEAGSPQPRQSRAGGGS